MTEPQPRGWPTTPLRAAACVAAILVLAGCAGHTPASSGSLGTAGNGVVPFSAPPAGNSAPSTQPTTAGPRGTVRPSTAPSHTSTPGTGHGPVHVSARVSALKADYKGACPPPADATGFQAVISVDSGPVTVTYRWTTSNGGDSDPSTRTVHFAGTGHQSTTVTHSEHWYPGAPYPASKSDWVAVDLMAPTSAQSNHVPMSISCVPFTVAIKRTSDDYKGPCPEPADALGFDVYVNSSEDTDATLHWALYDGGDSGPSPVSTVHLNYGMNVFHHYEGEYPPAPYPATGSDWVIASVTAGGWSATSDKVPFNIYCTS